MSNYELDGTDTDFVEIPEKCRKCPNVSILRSDFDRLVAIKGQITSDALDLMDMPEESRANIISSLAVANSLGLETELTPSDIISKIEEGVRQHFGNLLDSVEEDLDQTIEDTETILASCSDGTLGMRAKRGGTTFIATLCTTEIGQPTASIAPVHIKRESK